MLSTKEVIPAVHTKIFWTWVNRLYWARTRSLSLLYWSINLRIREGWWCREYEELFWRKVVERRDHMGASPRSGEESLSSSMGRARARASRSALSSTGMVGGTGAKKGPWRFVDGVKFGFGNSGTGRRRLVR